MAIVSFGKKDLQNLLGIKIDDKILKERIPLFGCTYEKEDEENVYYDVSPNRPDMLCIEGFARAIRNFIGCPKVADYKIKKGKVKIRIDSSVKSVRPYFVGAIVRNIKMSDEVIASLMQVQEKLHDTFGRKRKKVSIGIHDLEKVEPPFVYKGVKPESVKFVPLDIDKEMDMRQILEQHPKGIDYAHIVDKHDKWPLFVDKNNNVLSFPPIINGELTRVTENTKNILIDITGTDENAIGLALNILVTAFAERRFDVESVEIVDKKSKTTPNLDPIQMKIDVDYINKILGLKLTKTEIKSLLVRMGIETDDKVTKAIIPAYRTDIMHQIDVVEDIAIAYGYEKFVPKIPNVKTVAKTLDISECVGRVKNTMVGLGLQEVITMILTNEKDQFERMNTKSEAVVESKNSLSAECYMCRKLLLPSLLKVLSQNKHVTYPQNIFEVGDVVMLDKKSETGAKNVKNICCVISDYTATYEDIASLLAGLLASMKIGYKVKRCEHNSFIPGRVAEIIVGKKRVGIIGEIHPRVLKNWNLEMPVAAFEIDVESLK